MKSLTKLAKVVRPVIHRAGLDVVPYPPFRRAYSMDKVLLRLFERFEINCVIDVGAHHGEYGKYLRELGYVGRIVSFEPVESNYAILQERASGDAHWLVRNEALGREKERRTIHIPTTTELSSFLTANQYAASQFGQRSVVRNVEEVSVVRLGDVFDECIDGIGEARVYLKIDTQGWDLEVLAGADSVMPMVKACQSEVSVRAIYAGMSTFLDSISRFHELGYVVTGFYPVLCENDDVSKPIEFDVVMVRGVD